MSARKPAYQVIDFRIKICGVRTPQTITTCAAAGADAIGLNFYPKSIRYVQPESETAQIIRAQAELDSLVCVGVFVNEPSEEILRVRENLWLDAVQLHGDEPLEAAERLLRAGCEVIRAVRLPTTPLSPSEIQSRIGDWAELPVTLLLDADAGSRFGGGGKRLDWPSIAAWGKKHTRSLDASPWILAGGLTSENVAQARQLSGAERVDVASGVEFPKGEKSSGLIQKFVGQCRARGVDAER